jgi:branched-chain amino acid transport system permease protein
VSGTLSFIVTCATVATIYAVLSTALNLQYGMAGLANFGLVGFYGFGAFVTGMAMLPRSDARGEYLFTLGLAWPLAALLATLATAVFAGLVGFPALRAHMDEAGLAITTLAISQLLLLVLSSDDRIANGYNGVRGLDQPFSTAADALLGHGWYPVAFLVLAILVLAGCCLVAARVSAAPVGRVLRAVREDPAVAAALGHGVVGYELRAFMLGAAMCGAAGSLWAVYTRSVAPQAFLPDQTFIAWAALIVGGAGSIAGPVLGSIAVVGLVSEGTRFLPDFLGSHATPALRQVLIGLCLVLVLRFRPEGLRPEPRRRFATTREAAG